jgi:glycosyltransferase involved in cell wall biosynthesis
MRIAQVSPLYESVPPKLYGGTERVVSCLTEELVTMGHDVTLFASGDSVTSARLIAACPESLRLNQRCVDQLAHHYVMLADVLDRAREFDVIHFHIDYLHFPLTRIMGVPHLSTLHGRLDLDDLVPVYRKFNRTPLVSISRSQRKPLHWVNWIGNVYHGLPSNLLPAGDGSGGYLAFVGRISQEKRVDRAIQIASAVRMPLKIAAKVDRSDREYYETEIKPLLNNPYVEFVGEITEREKADFLGNAYASVFPIDWPEPFGLTMIEAMACGTPTIAFNCGSVPEVIREGVSGYIVRNVEEAIRAVERVADLDRAACRQDFEKRFTASRMAEDYVKLYQALVSAGSQPAEAPESILTL